MFISLQIVITLKSKIVEAAFKLSPDTARMCLRSGLQIQLLPSLRDIKLAQKHQCAAFIQEESYILVWDDNPERLLQHAADLEQQLVEIAWHSATGTYPKNHLSQYLDTSASAPLLELGGFGAREQTYINSVICACTLALSLLVVGLGMKVLAEEIALDHNYIRLTALLFTPIQFLLSLVGSGISSYISNILMSTSVFHASCHCVRFPAARSDWTVPFKHEILLGQTAVSEEDN